MTENEHPPKKPLGIMPAQNEVAKKAYAIYLKKGRPQGRDVQNWLEAETKMPHAGPEHPKGKAWHSQSAEEVLSQLGSAATGLSAAEAAKYLAANGPNELPERGRRPSCNDETRVTPEDIKTFIADCGYYCHREVLSMKNFKETT